MQPEVWSFAKGSDLIWPETGEVQLQQKLKEFQPVDQQMHP